MTSVRRPAVAGMFYPDDPADLRKTVTEFLSRVVVPADEPLPKAIIAPHAGYVYSGPIAATVYKRLERLRGMIKRVVLLGPCHRVPVLGLAASDADAFATPLGSIPLDKEAIAKVLALPQVEMFDATHVQEHSLEVHLPFLQLVLGSFKLVPLVVGQATPAQVAEVLEVLWGGDETLVVISTDLSHYLEYDRARRMDTETCRAIERLDSAALGRDSACGRIPVGGMLEMARRHGLKVTTLDLRSSGDTAGSRDQVVGYGAWMFTAKGGDRAATGSGSGEAAPDGCDEDSFGQDTRQLLRKHGETLLRLAAASIENGMRHGKPVHVVTAEFPPELKALGACFVTLKRRGTLRGCIGSLQGYRPLVEDVADNSFGAAFRDPRFDSLAPSEVKDLQLSISVLSKASPMSFTDEADLRAQLRPGIDGLIIQDTGRRALFLPSVWEQLPDKREFVAHLKRKAGLAVSHWSKTFKAWRFVTEEVSASDVLDDSSTLWTLG